MQLSICANAPIMLPVNPCLLEMLKNCLKMHKLS